MPKKDLITDWMGRELTLPPIWYDFTKSGQSPKRYKLLDTKYPGRKFTIIIIDGGTKIRNEHSIRIMFKNGKVFSNINLALGWLPIEIAEHFGVAGWGVHADLELNKHPHYKNHEFQNRKKIKGKTSL